MPLSSCCANICTHAVALANAGDEDTPDTAAVNTALADLECGEVIFDAGTFKVGTLHLRSNLRFTVTPTATVLARGAGHNDYDLGEDNPFDIYQDYGHSHFHDSLLWCDGCANLTFSGGGTIDGEGLEREEPAPGDGCRLLALRSCTGVIVEDLALKNGGWFAMLLNNVTNLVVRDVDIETERDGIDLVSSRHVLLERLTVHSSDDSIALKSDYALGSVIDSHDIVVRHCVLQSDTCNALQVGSETVGDLSNAVFQNISVVGAGKAGIGIATMDGAHVSNFLYEDVTMQGVSNVVFMYIGARANQRRPVPDVSAPMDDHVGSITNITIKNVVATDTLGYAGLHAKV